MTIKTHLFYSFIAHAIMLAYLLSLPLHRGTLRLDSFGDIFVHLTSWDTVSEQSGPMQKIQSTMTRKEVGKPAAQRESNVDKETQPPKIDIANERPEQAVEYREPPGNPKNEIILKEDTPPVEMKEVRKKGKEELEVKKIEEKEPLKIESPKPVEIKKTEETKSVQLAKAVDTKIESKTEKVVEKKTAPEEMITSEQPSRAPEEATEKEKIVLESTIKESSKLPESEKTPNALATVNEKGIDPGEKDSAKNVKPAYSSNMKASPKKPEEPVARNTKESRKRAVDAPKLSTDKVSVSKKDSAHGRRTAGKKDERPKERSAKGKASEDVHTKVKEAPALPPGQTGVPSNTVPLDGKSVSAATPHEGNPGPAAEQVITTAKSETKEEMKVKERKPSAGIPVSDVLLLNDIKIEITVRDADASNVSSHLFMRVHPDADRGRETGKQKEVGIIAEDSKEGLETKMVLYLAKADKGLYIFVMTNKSRATIRTDVLFHLFEKKKSERVKKFKSVQLLSNGELKIKFILPEAVFWDDEEYFTGTIESSDSLTKFNDSTGITWKEEKDGGM